MLNSKYQDIMNYPHYFSAGEMEYGIDGPEINDGKLYLSIYHYLQYTRLKPSNYNTIPLGKYLTDKSLFSPECKYLSQPFSINKFDIELIESELGEFDRFMK